MQLPEEKRELKYPAYFLGAALFLLAIVFLTPYNGLISGQSFLQSAQASQWGMPGDWLAAWCSLKIILLSVAVFFALLCIEEILLFARRVAAANLLIVALLLPIFGLLSGCYYFVKAIL